MKLSDNCGEEINILHLTRVDGSSYPSAKSFFLIYNHIMDNLLNTNGLREKNQQLLQELDNAYKLIQNYESLIAELRVENDSNLKRITHDLSNPLQILSMTIEFLQESHTLPKDLDTTLERMRRSTETMTEIIASIRKLRANVVSAQKKTIQIA
jgi:signal transduction histidine kinase